MERELLRLTYLLVLSCDCRVRLTKARFGHNLQVFSSNLLFTILAFLLLGASQRNIHDYVSGFMKSFLALGARVALCTQRITRQEHALIASCWIICYLPTERCLNRIFWWYRMKCRCVYDVWFEIILTIIFIVPHWNYRGLVSFHFYTIAFLSAEGALCLHLSLALLKFINISRWRLSRCMHSMYSALCPKLIL